jgi:hypothetical protein
LRQNKDIYKESVKEKLKTINPSNNQLYWTSICDSCIESSEELKPKYVKNHKYNSDIDILSEHQKNLRLKIETEKNVDKKKILKGARNKALQSIKEINIKAKHDKLYETIEEINASKDDSRRMFKAVKSITRKQDNTVFVQDENGHLVGNTKAKIKEITEHFKSAFQKDNAINCPNIEPSKLTIPFTKEEVKKAISSLKNNKSAGCDKLRAEHLKFAPDEINEHIANLLNNVAETGEYPKEIKTGLLTPLQKTGKRKVPQKI